MERAVTLARQCVSEEGKISPKVGAVVARGALMLGEAFRGELAPGDHAELTLLESKLGNETLDPNDAICGRGERRLRDAGIEISRFDSDLMAQIEEPTCERVNLDVCAR
jgi:pyrimidine deaminase RibD-like protein